MKRHEFEHAVRAAADVVKDEIVVIGSQAVLGQFPDPPSTLLVSLEVDVFPRSEPERADEIDGAIGDGSRFSETFGYWAHGVGPEALFVPAGWEERLIRIEFPANRPSGQTVVAWCLEAHDLVLGKLAAGRPHDRVFAEAAIENGLVDPEQLRLGIDLMPESHRDRTREELEGLLTQMERRGRRTA